MENIGLFRPVPVPSLNTTVQRSKAAQLIIVVHYRYVYSPNFWSNDGIKNIKILLFYSESFTKSMTDHLHVIMIYLTTPSLWNNNRSVVE